MFSVWDAESESDERPLRAYLLGTLPWGTLFALQRRIIYDVSGDPSLATLILCDHPISITMGRTASRLHVRLSPETLADREWDLHWLARGGGCWLHTPGQVAAYVMLPIQHYQLSPVGFVQTLNEAIGEVVTRLCPHAAPDRESPGWRVRGRRVATIGASIRSGVSSFGAVINVNPDLELFEAIQCDGDSRPMTSLARESGLRVRVASVRQQLLGAIQTRFSCSRVSVFHHHPALSETAGRYANLARGRET